MEICQLDRVPKQGRRTRSCILISLKDKTEYPFRSLVDADAFLDRRYGYTRGCLKNGCRLSMTHEDGTVEYFDIILGPQVKVYTTVHRTQEQPCWTCWNCFDGCSWSIDFTPVKGWDADEIMKDGDITYQINYCPEYKSDQKEKKK